MFKSITKVTISSKASPEVLWALNKFDIKANTTQKDW